MEGLPKLLEVSVDWLDDVGNLPEFRVKLSRIPKRYELTYRERGGLYLATLGDYASFLYYDRPGQGFGGATFELHMDDGSTRRLIGPWSSNSSDANRMFPETPVVEASQGGLAFAVTQASIVDWVRRNRPNFGLAVTDFYGGRMLQPTREGLTKRDEYRILEVLV